MKIHNEANYLVQVFPAAWEQADERRPLYDGIFTLALNIPVQVTFVPDLGGTEPPWPPGQDLPSAELTTPGQVRWDELLAASYAVTPNASRASEVIQMGPPDAPTTIFFVQPDEFVEFRRELEDLAERTAERPLPRRNEVLDLNVMRFADEYVLGSSRLNPADAAIVGRTSSAV